VVGARVYALVAEWRSGRAARARELANARRSNASLCLDALASMLDGLRRGLVKATCIVTRGYSVL
jgi:hypothetical protein